MWLRSSVVRFKAPTCMFGFKPALFPLPPVGAWSVLGTNKNTQHNCFGIYRRQLPLSTALACQEGQE